MTADVETQLRRLAELVDPARAARLVAAADVLAELDAELDALFNRKHQT